LRNTWKEKGLGLLNLLVVVVVLVGIQPLLRKYLGAAGAAVLAVLCLATYVAASRWIERRVPTELAIHRVLPELATGMLVGLGLFCLLMGILWAAGAYNPEGWSAHTLLAHGFPFALLAGIVEEILFRGLLFRVFSKILGTWGALLLTSALFGLAHAANPGATVSSSLAIALEAGILLGTACAATSRLWLPIGLHVGWNFTEGSLFGMTLSGNNMGSGLLRGSLSGSRILTGGEFGPEASIVAVIVCMAAALFFVWRILKLHLAEPPVWSKPPQSVAVVATPSA
jgi:uncharacterized protein